MRQISQIPLPSGIQVNGNIIVVSAEDDSFAGGDAANNKGGIYRSVNNGVNWTCQSVDAGWNSCNALVRDKINPDVPLFCDL